MSMFKQDDLNGDWLREDGGFSRVSGATESTQHVKTRLRLFTGEVARDVRVGVDLDLLLDPQADQTLIANHVADVILETPGVIEASAAFEVIDPERGDVQVTFEGVFEQADLTEKRVEHERVLIRTGSGG